MLDREAVDETAERIDDRIGLGDAHLNLAFTYAMQGDEAGALESGRQAAEIFEELGDARRTAVILMTLPTRPSVDVWYSSVTMMPALAILAVVGCSLLVISRSGSRWAV